jgi:hypothetical protein
MPNAPMPDEGVAGGSTGGDGGLATGEDAGSSTTDRQVIMTGNVTITADDPIAASREAVRIVEAAGGRVDGRTEYAPTGGDKGSASLELRIPADKLTATLDKLEKLGRADEVSLSTSDVTVESQDLDARINALRASIERLDGLIAKAKNIDDLITLEGAISSRQAELESLEAQQRYLATRCRCRRCRSTCAPTPRRRRSCPATSGRVSPPAGAHSSPSGPDCSWCSGCCSRG